MKVAGVTIYFQQYSLATIFWSINSLKISVYSSSLTSPPSPPSSVFLFVTICLVANLSITTPAINDFGSIINGELDVNFIKSKFDLLSNVISLSTILISFFSLCNLNHGIFSSSFILAHTRDANSIASGRSILSVSQRTSRYISAKHKKAFWDILLAN
ncbi:hypothetical protein RIR_jg14604.t1 [Rhizophagus irregularis DAOM 181602=DAOM 197198]|nr:hypothetical protein RIR_jg14604.t1 [Rhizophagus irregularis DAOM 181602=DAOM 197198]